MKQWWEALWALPAKFLGRIHGVHLSFTAWEVPQVQTQALEGRTRCFSNGAVPDCQLLCLILGQAGGAGTFSRRGHSCVC